MYEWHQLLINFVNSNSKGDTKPFIPEPYNWKTYGDMNVEFWEKHQGTSFDEAVKLVNESHEEVLKLMEKFTNEELFTKKYYTWVGTSNLGSYFVSAGPSHYDWAMKKIKLYKKDLNK